MKRVSGYRCTICGGEFPFGPELYTCPRCGEKGILDIVYDYGEVKKVLTRETLAQNRDNSMWRYRALMPVADTTDVSRFLRIGWSPLYESRKLRDELGLKALYIQDDGINPTASLKGTFPLFLVPVAIAIIIVTIYRQIKGTAPGGLPTTIVVIILCIAGAAVGLILGIPPLAAAFVG